MRWNILMNNVFLVCKLLKNSHLNPQLNFHHSLKKFRYLNEILNINLICELDFCLIHYHC